MNKSFHTSSILDADARAESSLLQMKLVLLSLPLLELRCLLAALHQCHLLLTLLPLKFTLLSTFLHLNGTIK